MMFFRKSSIMVMSIGPRNWALLFFLSSMISFSLSAIETSCKKQELKQEHIEIDDRRVLDSYCAVIAGMSAMTLVHGFWQAEYVETLVGVVGLMVSLGAMLWPEHEAQTATIVAKADNLLPEQQEYAKTKTDVKQDF